MLLTRGIFPQIQSARIGSCEAYHGVSRIAGRSRRVCDCRNFLVAGLRLQRRRGRVWLRTGPRRPVVETGFFQTGFFRLDILRLERLKIGAHAPMDSGDAEGFASVMEDCV